ncbi:Protein CBG16485 [Caenorhabditis briggsae]|uniref:Uncharacterized protein n=2 Tax=Caenorhabditis briggsae TaxID=6238 RepID=A0AAE9IPH2_CAEBR|nr:Protein CBG16485 [Caenorhabditis briggsae]ULU00980.1 hypothetical protein L3Y34_001408 [Caenorhabditis briggsae]CAP34436.2 Protein CBG16485 [Caenorhabditis briggsae]
MKKEFGVEKTAHALERSIQRRLEKVENLVGLSTMEKVKLLVLFSRRLTPVFAKVSPDGIILQSPPVRNVSDTQVTAKDLPIEVTRAEDWILDKKSELPQDISLRKLTDQIEAFAYNYDMEEWFKQKARRAVWLYKDKDQTIPLQEFNNLFDAVARSLTRESVQKTDVNTMQLMNFFNILGENLNRSFGGDAMK